MSHEANSDAAKAPTFPERTMRPSEDNRRMSEDTETKRPMRSSMQSSARAFASRPSHLEPQSYDRQHELAPSHQQTTQWQPQQTAPLAVSVHYVQYGHPAEYGQNVTSNDYAVYDRATTAGLYKNANRPLTDSEIYFQSAYQGSRVESNGPLSGMVFMLAKEKHNATYMAPIGIGLALFVAELVEVLFTGGSLNPARSLGPCITTGQFDPDHWVYWVGPAVGASAAFIFYRFIKILEYEMANPGQDNSDEDKEVVSRRSEESRDQV